MLSANITLQLIMKIEEINNMNSTSATRGDDYIPGPYNVIFPAGVTSASFNVPIIDDNVLESDEHIFLRIDSSSLPSRFIVTDPSQATLTIVNDDSVVVRFDQSKYSVNENNGSIQAVLVFSGPSSTNVTLGILVVAGTANSDAIGSYSVIFPAGETSVSFNIPITNDDEVEEEEIFYLKIRSRLLPDKVTRGRPYRVAVNILDDDNITLKFNQPVYSVNEDMKLVKIVLVLSNPISTAITLKINDSNSTASRNADYTPGPYDVMILAGTTSVSFNVSIKDDMMLEGNEYFTLSINLFHLPNVIITNHQARVTIVDNDRATICFNESKYTINPNSSVLQPVLVLNISSSVNISIEVKLRGSEPFPVLFPILFPARETMASFDVRLTNGIKMMKKFRLVIIQRSLPYYITCNSNCNTKVIMK